MHFAARDGSIEMVQQLLRAGADVHPRNGRGNSALEEAANNRKRHLYPMLLAAGARIMPNAYGDAYLRKVFAAGGFKAYEKAHRAKLLATFTPKLTYLVPPELVPLIVEFSFHVGFY